MSSLKSLVCPRNDLKSKRKTILAWVTKETLKTQSFLVSALLTYIHTQTNKDTILLEKSNFKSLKKFSTERWTKAFLYGMMIKTSKIIMEETANQRLITMRDHLLPLTIIALFSLSTLNYLFILIHLVKLLFLSYLWFDSNWDKN